MEFEYWWLLALPLFFVMGWAAARIDIRQIVNESRALPRSYFKGLNFLLNEQPDKAIEAFIEVVKVDPETIELHFALGDLAKGAGNAEQAIEQWKRIESQNPAYLALAAQRLYETYREAGRAEEGL